MKKVNYIGLLLVTLLFASCDLDKYPYSEVAADEYVKNASSVNNLVLGCYNSLHDVMYYEWAMTELRSDNGRMLLVLPPALRNWLNSLTRELSWQSTNGWKSIGILVMQRLPVSIMRFHILMW